MGMGLTFENGYPYGYGYIRPKTTPCPSLSSVLWRRTKSDDLGREELKESAGR